MTTNAPRHVLADCCSAFSSTRPDARPSSRRWHPLADRVLAATRPWLVPLLIAAGMLASFASGYLGSGARMLPLAAFFLVAGGWCTLNLARSREAHCLVTGVGWSGLGVLALVAGGLGADWREPAWIAFFVVLAVAICFEAGWSAVQGTTALRWRRETGQS